ncbi:DMT family transporter, partial [Mesorhizobium sp. M4B.F.Ca.ET.019.03.1.1]
VSPIGDGLALLIACMFSIATVITRRFAHVRMTPANCLAALLACAFAASQASEFAVSSRDMAFLFAFGVLNLGVGLAFFATGARLVPAAMAALLGTFEPILGPIWVWLVHSEVPSARTIVGGAVVVAALLVHIALEFKRQARPERPGVTGVPSPN